MKKYKFIIHRSGMPLFPSQSYWMFKSLKYIHYTAIPRKSTLNLSIFSYIFKNKCLRLGSYNVLGTKTKLLIELIFDLGLRSENIKFLKCPPCQKSSKLKNSNFQFDIFIFVAQIKNLLHQKFWFGP